MSLITDLRAVSDNAIEQVAARFADLPRPLLAAIGAGDLAVERLAELRQQLETSVADRVSGTPLDVKDVRTTVSELPGKAQHVAADLQGRAHKAAADLPGKAQQLAADLPGRAQKVAADLPGKAQQVAADLPSKAQKVAADVAGNIEHFAAEAPGMAQDLIAQLPGRLAEFQAAAMSLSPDAIKETIEAYTQLVGMIYGKLAERGDKSWSKVRATGLHLGAVVDEATTTAQPAESDSTATAGNGAEAGAAPAAEAPAVEPIDEAPAVEAAADAPARKKSPAPRAAKVTEPTPVVRKAAPKVDGPGDVDGPEHPHVVPPGAHVKADES